MDYSEIETIKIANAFNCKVQSAPMQKWAESFVEDSNSYNQHPALLDPYTRKFINDEEWMDLAGSRSVSRTLITTKEMLIQATGDYLPFCEAPGFDRLSMIKSAVDIPSKVVYEYGVHHELGHAVANANSYFEDEKKNRDLWNAKCEAFADGWATLQGSEDTRNLIIRYRQHNHDPKNVVSSSYACSTKILANLSLIHENDLNKRAEKLYKTVQKYITEDDLESLKNNDINPKYRVTVEKYFQKCLEELLKTPKKLTHLEPLISLKNIIHKENIEFKRADFWYACLGSHMEKKVNKEHSHLKLDFLRHVSCTALSNKEIFEKNYVSAKEQLRKNLEGQPNLIENFLKATRELEEPKEKKEIRTI